VGLAHVHGTAPLQALRQTNVLQYQGLLCRTDHQLVVLVVVVRWSMQA
jgi:hypothetical protein